jgi:hypothetical protein
MEYVVLLYFYQTKVELYFSSLFITNIYSTEEKKDEVYFVSLISQITESVIETVALHDVVYSYCTWIIIFNSS